MPSDTPLTDDQILTIECEDSCCGIYVKRGDEDVTGDVVPAEFARKLEVYNTQIAREVADDERWIKEVLTDFRILFDDHKVGRRIALTQWMAEQKAEIARLDAYIQDITWHPNWEPTKV